MLTLHIPLKTVSAANAREHWRAKHRRVKAEREAIAWMLKAKSPPPLPLPLVVTMTRLGPSNGLDDDNLASAFKAVRDQIAQWLGVDDRSPLVRWVCAQRREPKWGVLIELEAAHG